MTQQHLQREQLASERIEITDQPPRLIIKPIQQLEIDVEEQNTTEIEENTIPPMDNTPIVDDQSF